MNKRQQAKQHFVVLNEAMSGLFASLYISSLDLHIFLFCLIGKTIKNRNWAQNWVHCKEGKGAQKGNKSESRKK